MPKIIENARESIICEAKKQIAENGYESVTIRSIAKGCGLGLGTFYNYFKSKDLLIATFLLDEWQELISSVLLQSRGVKDPMLAVERLHYAIAQFISNNKAIFESSSAKKAFNNSVSTYHDVLRAQLAEPIFNVCSEAGYENAKFLSEFVAEATLTWTVAKKSFDEIAPIISRLFVK